MVLACQAKVTRKRANNGFPIIGLIPTTELCSGQYADVKNALLISPREKERWIAGRSLEKCAVLLLQGWSKIL
jgi:hypothetical protein